MSESPCAFIKELIPMMRKVGLESIEHAQRHSTRLAGDYFNFTINLLLRVHTI
jgi:hypothetical protein